MKHGAWMAVLMGVWLPAVAGADLWDNEFDREAHEEFAGASAAFLFNPVDEIYGVGIGAGTWLTGTPVFGDYFVQLFSNGLEDAPYSALGMTIRLMPHWKLAPFAGAGGSYNQVLDGSSDEDEAGDVVVNDTDLSARGLSYWGGHVEAGLRWSLSGPVRLLEIAGRYIWSSNDGDVDTWVLLIGTGAGW